MKISIGCDHIVTEIKDHIVKYLTDKGHEVIDNGTYDKERTHYPIYGKKTAEVVATGEADVGIVICGTGVGISVSANKVKGIRAALVGDVETARYAKESLNANVLAMGGRIVGLGVIENTIDVFLGTKYKETEENKALIERIDSIDMNQDLVQDEHFFDEFIEKWDQGVYHK
ncbi:galactose-6-phosphate isomerase subunit LacB [Virgibacillus sp. NKC19-3]|uniref:galactose-6-phosphate isomerase subunit LacB n=1 Tax=Virgibacillus saliphilus TaxID=2831674 RepID=UPI001C9A774C|nr:galactose-6-phosphate isomerase subunit LacB [Virgibacillus sp. NKC19-3]MBY7142867.1 galactose-6-phosphate isomerase subunit LacB [Virgibacillus sp. NKC19-3]